MYLSIITQALTFALMLAFFRNEMGFGGNNGLTDFRELLGFNLRSDATRLGLFIATGVALALGYILCRAIVTSKLGRVCVATRDAEARTRFIGYRVERFQLFVFVVSAMLAGLAGRSMCRKWVLSTPANSLRCSRLKSCCGWRWVAGPHCTAR
ncbi:hypothetical protein HAALTHF_12890n [Vreelandella aquamarina]|nr:hypothetical protein HAALTHF_12890n [Halomonas axialensis]